MRGGVRVRLHSVVSDVLMATAATIAVFVVSGPEALWMRIPDLRKHKQ